MSLLIGLPLGLVFALATAVLFGGLLAGTLALLEGSLCLEGLFEDGTWGWALVSPTFTYLRDTLVVVELRVELGGVPGGGGSLQRHDWDKNY